MEDNFNFLYSGLDCQNYILDKINLAQKHIYISSWNIYLEYILDKKNNKTLLEILLDKCNKNIKVYILTSETPGSYTNYYNDIIIKTNKHKNLNIKIVKMHKSSNLNNFCAKLLNYINYKSFSFKKCCNKLFHQRYFNVDNKYCMIGGCDLTSDMYCKLSENIYNNNLYYWIEYGICFKPKNDFIQYCYNNYINNGSDSIKSYYLFGNFYNINTEYKFLLQLIKNCKESIFIENQWLGSSNQTKNNFIKNILDKCISNENIIVTIITNKFFTDNCSDSKTIDFSSIIHCKLYTLYYKNIYDNCICYIYNYLLKHNFSIDRIHKQIYIYVPPKNIFIHSKNIIVDHTHLLYGTSNIWDRSYTTRQDLELSIYLKNNIKVTQIEKNIINIYNKSLKRILFK